MIDMVTVLAQWVDPLVSDAWVDMLEAQECFSFSFVRESYCSMCNRAGLNNGGSYHPAEIEWFAFSGLIDAQRRKYMAEQGL